MEKKYDSEGNVVFNAEEQYVKFYINPRIYPMNVVSQAAYVLMDRAAVILSGNPDERIIAELRPFTNPYDLNKLIKEFNDELINYSSFFFFSEKSRAFRDALLSSILHGSILPAGLKDEIKNPQKDIDDIDKIFEEWEKDSDDDFDEK